MSDLPEGWVKKVSNSTGKEYYFNPSTNHSQWEKPTSDGDGRARASHLLVKHTKSRRPSSWKQDVITRSEDEALEMIKGKFYYVFDQRWKDLVGLHINLCIIGIESTL